MTRAIQLFPDFPLPPWQSFKLILLAEGYTADEQHGFAQHCNDLVENLLDLTPFNLTRAWPQWFGVYCAFTASTQHGPAIDTASPGSTAYEARLDTATGTLTLNVAKVNAALADLTLAHQAEDIALHELLQKGTPTYGPIGGAVVVLLPAVEAAPNGGELEYQPGENDFYFAAVTQNGAWHQVVARVIARVLGMGDEFDLPGVEQGSPSVELGPWLEAQFANLVYLATPPAEPPDTTFPWYYLLTSEQRVRGLTAHPHPGAAEQPDRTFPEMLTWPTIELWEGGAGFRTQIYRSAQDCLMRRRIGDRSLPVRTQPVPFCRVCTLRLSSTIKGSLAA